MTNIIHRLLLIYLIVGFPASSSFAEEPDFSIGGWSESIVSVSDLDSHQRFFTDIAQWTLLEEGEVSQTQIQAWQLPDSASAEYRLFANAGTDSGYIRLVKVDGVKQELIRLDPQSWDTGGVFDLNVRVKDLRSVATQVRRLGWQATAPITTFTFGPFKVKEWIVKSPEGLAFAMIERLEPKLEGWPHLRSVSRAFNSTQVVKDMDSSLQFFEQVLGFKRYLEHQGASEKAGANVLGLPHNATTEVPRTVYILHPQGINEGSVELLSFDGADGADFSSRVSMSNLGIVTLRFPVAGIEALQRHLEKHNVVLVHGVQEIDGKKSLLVRAPEGALLEFTE